MIGTCRIKRRDRQSRYFAEPDQLQTRVYGAANHAPGDGVPSAPAMDTTLIDSTAKLLRQWMRGYSHNAFIKAEQPSNSVPCCQIKHNKFQQYWLACNCLTL